MNDEVIEPSEIFVQGDGTIRREATRANPWLRLLGRMFDYALFFLSLAFLRRILGFSLIPQIEGLVPLEYLAWIPLEAALLWGLGTTPGKWLVGTDLKQGKNLRLDYITAIRRATKVWLRGLGMAIPFLNAICMLVAYQKLMTFKTTTWDREEHIQVTHHPIGTWRLVLAAAISIFGLAYYFGVETRPM